MAAEHPGDTYMCGICGVFGEHSKNQIKSMASTLIHRGPDQEGYYFDKNLGLGFRRLSIIDLSSGNQPIYNEDKSICVIFNGEIYNFRELRKILEKNNHKFYTNSDTEVIVHAYEQFGENDFADKLNGMFAIALYDSNKKKLILVRDRVGIKPLYYYLKDNLVFASEIKAVLASGEIEKTEKNIDLDALTSYFVYGISLGEKTLFKEVKRLLPGHQLVYDGKNIKIKNYVKPYSKEGLTISPEYLKKTLEKVVNSQMVADVPVGAYLSGGIDSSTVVALMSKTNKNLKTFNIGFGREDDESKYARLIAEHIGTDHHELFIYPEEVPKMLEDFIYYYDDVNWDAAALPVYKLSKYAKKHVTVVLTGEGGDEMFAGYNRYKFFSNLFWPLPGRFKLSFYKYFLKMFSNHYIKKLIKNPSNYSNNKFKQYFSSMDLDSLLRFEISETLPNQLLTKVDRATMAASLEARVPLLDNEILRFSHFTPNNLKLRGLEGKHIFREAVKDLLPSTTLKRPKKGFGASPYLWLKNKEIFDFAISVLENPQVNIDGYNTNTWKDLSDLSGIQKSKKGHMLWVMLLFELWYRKFMH